MRWIRYLQPLKSLIHILNLFLLSENKSTNTSTSYFFTLHIKLIHQVRIKSLSTPLQYRKCFHCIQFHIIPLAYSEISLTLTSSFTVSIHVFHTLHLFLVSSARQLFKFLTNQISSSYLQSLLSILLILTIQSKISISTAFVFHIP